MLSNPGRGCLGGRCSEAPDGRPGGQKGPKSFEEPSKFHRNITLTTPSLHRASTVAIPCLFGESKTLWKRSNVNKPLLHWCPVCRGGGGNADPRGICTNFLRRPGSYFCSMPIFLRNGSSERLRPRNFSMDMFASRESPGS